MQRLRTYLDSEGMSQADFARAVGVTQPTVWEWLNGHSRPSTERLLKISEATGLSIDELLRESVA